MDDYDKLINSLLEDPTIQKTYDDCIIKDITFKEWVIGVVDNMNRPKKYDVNKILAEIMK